MSWLLGCAVAPCADQLRKVCATDSTITIEVLGTRAVGQIIGHVDECLDLFTLCIDLRLDGEAVSLSSMLALERVGFEAKSNKAGTSNMRHPMPPSDCPLGRQDPS